MSESRLAEIGRNLQVLRQKRGLTQRATLIKLTLISVALCIFSFFCEKLRKYDVKKHGFILDVNKSVLPEGESSLPSLHHY